MTHRNAKGRYTRKSKFIAAILFLTIASIGFTGYFNKWYANEITAVAPAIIPFPQKAEAAETEESRIANNLEEFKNAIIDDLASKCESRDVKEPDAAIILDTDGFMSIGAWMYHITTVQLYYKMFYNKEINRVEAIHIATDHALARELTMKIVYEDKGKGIDNWKNCADTLGLHEKVALVKKLEK